MTDGYRGRKGVVIAATALGKWYGEVIGLNNFTLEVKPGVTGIVGPNGSGKSTFFKLVLGLIKPNTGSITVFGQKPWGNSELHSEIGFCPDYESLPSDSTGREYLSLIGHLHAMEGSTLLNRTEEVAKLVEMGHALRQAMKETLGRDLPMNVDGGIAAVLCELGFPPELGNGFFAISRTVGLTAQVHEEMTRERPMRKISPTAQEYDGPPDRELEIGA